MTGLILHCISNCVLTQGQEVLASVDGSVLYKGADDKQFSKHGFVALGTDEFGQADFDNLAILPTS